MTNPTRPSGRGCVLGILGLIVAGIVIISVAALIYERTPPPVVREPAWPNPETRALAVRACFDCHSNQTHWPWYDQVPPGSWLAVYDTIRGRRALNYSEWGVPRQGFLGGEGEGGRGGFEGGGGEGGGGAARQIERGSMPPSLYLMLHPEARLTDAEKQQLIQGLQALQ